MNQFDGATCLIRKDNFAISQSWFLTRASSAKSVFFCITERMKKAFLELWRFLENSKNVTPTHAAHLDNMVFPHTTFKKSWDTVRTSRRLPHLRLRDLRRDCTRLGRLGYRQNSPNEAPATRKCKQASNTPNSTRPPLCRQSPFSTWIIAEDGQAVEMSNLLY